MKSLAVAAILVASTAGAEARGTCVAIRDVEARTEWRSDPSKCAARLSPASTFKIPHAAIALETGVVTAATVEKWDGAKYTNASWPRDHTLVSAIRNSVLWFFQRTGRRVGADRMRGYLQRFGYGNADTSGDPTRYWVNGTLRISSDEQLGLLEKFFTGQLPINADHIRFVQDAMLQQSGTIQNARGIYKMPATWKPETRVMAKTGGTTMPDGIGVSWLVGAVTARRARRCLPLR